MKRVRTIPFTPRRAWAGPVISPLFNFLDFPFPSAIYGANGSPDDVAEKVQPRARRMAHG